MKIETHFFPTPKHFLQYFNCFFPSTPHFLQFIYILAKKLNRILLSKAKTIVQYIENYFSDD